MTTGLEVGPAAVARRFVELTPRSGAAFERTCSVVPGGLAAGTGGGTPYPVSIVRGQGCRLWDADGRELLDMIQGDWLLPLGHGNPMTIAAIQEQLAKGTTFAAPAADPDLACEFAVLLRNRIPSMERLRFATSGTEATMFALRLARAFTGRTKVAKIRGGYHGTNDPSLLANFRWRDPDFVPPGLQPGTLESTVLLPFNDIEGTRRVVAEHGDDLAGVIVEPVLGGSGMIPGDRRYLHALREITQEHGVLLIFDEMVTFTYGVGAAQGHYEVVPDLTTIGKAVGGGLPLAAFGGRADVMALVDPLAHDGGPPVRQGSTFGGIPICLAAGMAQVSQLTPEVHVKLHRLGARARDGINALGKAHGIPLQATGAAHYFALQWTPTPVVDFDTAVTCDRSIVSQLALALNTEGYLLFSSNGIGMASEPMDDDDIDGFLQALERSLVHLGLVG